MLQCADPTRVVACVCWMTFRPAFRRSRTFALFALLATGLVAQTTRRTVVGMLAGAGMAAVVSFHSACRFFSHHAWDTDRLGLALARLIVDRLLRRGRADRGGGRRHAVPPLGAEGVRRVLDPRRVRAGPEQARPRQPVGDRRDRRHGAVLQPPGVPAGAVAVVARQGHRLPGAAGRRADFDSGASLPGPTHPRRRRRRLPRQAAAGAGLPRSPPGCPANAALYAPGAAAHRQPRPTPAKGAPAAAVPPSWPPPRRGARVTVTRYGRIDTVEIAVIAQPLVRRRSATPPGRAVLVREPDDDTACWRSSPPTPTADTERSSPATPHRWP